MRSFYRQYLRNGQVMPGVRLVPWHCMNCSGMKNLPNVLQVFLGYCTDCTWQWKEYLFTSIETKSLGYHKLSRHWFPRSRDSCWWSSAETWWRVSFHSAWASPIVATVATAGFLTTWVTWKSRSQRYKSSWQKSRCLDFGWDMVLGIVGVSETHTFATKQIHTVDYTRICYKFHLFLSSPPSC